VVHAPAAGPPAPAGISAPLRERLLREWGAELISWNNRAAVTAYAKAEVNDNRVRELYSEYRRILVAPPDPRMTPVVFTAGEKERLEERALAWKLQHLLLAMPEPAFAKYGILLGGMRQVLFLGQKYIPEIARQDFSHRFIWWSFHQDWTARTAAAYAELFPAR
jgi:hypothetical protein